MPRFERKPKRHPDNPGDPQAGASASPGPPGSIAEAEDAAARIAELVRRTAERDARPGPSSVPRSFPTAAQPHPPAQPVAPQVTPAPHRPARLAARLRSRRVLVAAGAIAVVLVAGSSALTNRFGSGAVPTATVSTPRTQRSVPAGYAVKVTDVTTDCARHSHGRTRTSFEAQNCVKATRSLATGRVGGRPVLLVISRIQMPSAEAAATIKQVLDGSGTGNLDDLLREGRTFPGAPDRMPSSGYTSVQSGAVVTVAEAGFTDGGHSSNSDPALRAAAAQVAALVSAQT